MEKLYENNSFLQNFKGQVTECTPVEDGYLIVLNQTGFFPEGGGQNCDIGYLDQCQVEDVFEKDGVVFHKTKESLTVGATVTGQINWQRRFDYMQQHSGEHIVSGIVHRKFGYNNVGFHLGDDYVTLDFDGTLTEENLKQVEEEANRAVFENRKITVTYPSKEQLKTIDYRSKIDIPGQVRLVTVEGYDICACCAPHVNETGSIGLIKITGCQKYKSGVRLNIACGFRALKDYRTQWENTKAISVLLSVKQDETAGAVSNLYKDNQQLKYQVMAAKEQAIIERLKTMDMNQEYICLFEASMEQAVMKRVFNAMKDNAKGYFALFSGNDLEGYKYFIGAKVGDAKAVGDVLKARFQCQGGGNQEMIQGFVKADEKQLKEVFMEIK